MSLRPIQRVMPSKSPLDGAGLHPHRAFGFAKTGDFDPFSLGLFENGGEVRGQAGPDGISVLLISGAPLEEPAWYGPVVMNAQSSCSRPSANSRRGHFSSRPRTRNRRCHGPSARQAGSRS